jgi:hypothetical protein
LQGNKKEQPSFRFARNDEQEQREDYLMRLIVAVIAALAWTVSAVAPAAAAD